MGYQPIFRIGGGNNLRDHRLVAIGIKVYQLKGIGALFQVVYDQFNLVARKS